MWKTPSSASVTAVVTIRPSKVASRAPTASRPDLVWLADITQHRTDEGWLYLAVVLDAADRMVVGWSMSERASAELVVDAVSLAVGRRRPKVGTIHHSDRGSQYTSLRFTEHLQQSGLVGSMGRSAVPATTP
jgi:putative transposase